MWHDVDGQKLLLPASVRVLVAGCEMSRADVGEGERAEVTKLSRMCHGRTSTIKLARFQTELLPTYITILMHAFAAGGTADSEQAAPVDVSSFEAMRPAGGASENAAGVCVPESPAMFHAYSVN